MSNSNNNLEWQKQQIIADILIVTVTKIETIAVLNSVDSYTPIYKNNKTYYDLGCVGGAKTLLLCSEMGSEGPSGSTLIISEAINTVHPSHIIMIGIAFGINPDKQRIGDILVSRQILAYELQRVGTGKENERSIRFRGDRVSASPKLLDRFRDGDIHWTGPPVEFGLILSGQKLLDNLNFRNQLREMEPEAIGGEMEGAGLYSAASLKKVDWILIKAICDWADGKKHEEKTQRQQQAAENAAHFAIHVIKQGGFSKEEQFVGNQSCSPKDSEPEKISKFFEENMQETRTPSQHFPLEPIGGAVPLDSKFYVERQTDQIFQDMIDRRDSIVLLKGARQVGKTSLLARRLDAARQAGMRVLLTDFQKLADSQLKNLDTFFIAIGQILARQLGLRVNPQDVWQTDYSPHMNFENFFVDEILATSEEPVLWAIDETDRFFLYPFSSQVFALFRSWHNQRALEPTHPCSRLTLVITYATEYMLIKDKNQSPFNVGTKLVLEDFTLEQVVDLNQRYGSPLRGDAELRRFHQLLGGQPYLVRCGLNDIVNRHLTVDEFIQIADHEGGTFNDHLRRILLLLNDNERLSEVVRGVLRGKPCPDYDSFNHLRGAGILKGDSKNNVYFRCKIYESYLRKHWL